MKINSTNMVTNPVITERKALNVSTGNVATNGNATVDRTTLRTSVPTVSSLAKQAMQTPSVRQDRVNSLRDSISSGNYPIDTVKIAGAIIDESSK